MFALFLFTFKGNIQCAKRVYIWPWDTLTVINGRSCIVRQKQWWNFLGKESWNLALALVKNPHHCKIYIKRSRYFFIRRKQNSPITSHAKLALCKECNQILLFSYICWRAGKSRFADSVSNRIFLKRGLQPHRGSCFFLNRAAVGWAVSCSAFVFFFCR